MSRFSFSSAVATRRSRVLGLLLLALVGLLLRTLPSAHAQEQPAPNPAPEPSPVPEVDGSVPSEGLPETDASVPGAALEADAEAPTAAPPESPIPAEAGPIEVGPADAGPALDDAEVPPAQPPALTTAPRAVPAVAPRAQVVDPVAPLDITVVGTRLSRTAGSAHVIRSKELERFEYDDAALVLSSVPGVYSRTEDGMGLRPNIGLRGVNPDRSKKVTLMEDGVLFGPAPYSAPAAYYFPVITRMSQVRVIKGPGSVAYGPQTVGGAIDLVTRGIPSKASGGLDLAAGQYGYGKGHGYFGASNEQFGFVVEGVRLQNSGFKDLPKGGDTGFVRNEWMGKFAYVVDPVATIRNEFRLKLTYSDEVSNETYLGLTDADFKRHPYQRYGATALDRMKNHRFSTVLTHQADFNPRTSLTTTAYRHTYQRTWRRGDTFRGASLFDVLENPSSGSNALYVDALQGNGESSSISPTEAFVLATNGREFLSQGVQTLFRWDGRTGAIAHRVEAGLRLHYDRIERRHLGENFDIAGGDLYPNGSATTVTAFNKGETYAVAPHVLYAITWGRVTLTPGMRTELMRMSFIDRATGEGVKGFNYALLPGIGAYYAITEELGVLAGAYRGFSPPPPENSDHTRPEHSINYEAGARFTRGLMRTELIGFFNDYSNLTNICTASGGGCDATHLDQQANAGRANIYGVEASASHDLPIRKVKLPLSASYTYTKAEFGQTFKSFDPIWGDVRKGDDIPYVPQHQLRASAGVEGKPAGASLGFTYVAAMNEGHIGSGTSRRLLKTDSQYLLDASAYAKVWGPISLYLTGQNLVGSTFLVARRPFGARPNAPRWIHVGLKAAF